MFSVESARAEQAIGWILATIGGVWLSIKTGRSRVISCLSAPNQLPAAKRRLREFFMSQIRTVSEFRTPVLDGGGRALGMAQ